MPTMNNICSKLVSKLALLPFTVMICEVSTQTLWQVTKLDTKPTNDTAFTIVLDQNHQESPLNYPDTYYCNSENELEQIVDFVVQNPIMYYLNIQNNEYDALLNIFPYKPIEYTKTTE